MFLSAGLLVILLGVCGTFAQLPTLSSGPSPSLSPAPAPSFSELPFLSATEAQELLCSRTVTTVQYVQALLDFYQSGGFSCLNAFITLNATQVREQTKRTLLNRLSQKTSRVQSCKSCLPDRKTLSALSSTALLSCIYDCTSCFGHVT